MDEAIPRSFHGDVLKPSPYHDREPSDPPLRFLHREKWDGFEENDRDNILVKRKTPPTESYPTESPSDYRVPPSRYDESLVAPPSVDCSRIPDPLVTCGCEDWEISHHDPDSDGDDEVRQTADVCPNPCPVMRGTARQIYRRIVTANDPDLGGEDTDDENDDGDDGEDDDGDSYMTSKLQDARRRYARLRDGDAYLQAEMDGLTTVLISLRLSPVDPDSGLLLTPWQLSEDLFQNLGSVMDAVRYTLGQKHGFRYEWARVISGTEGYATPHCHLYLYVQDPNDAVDHEMFRSAISKFVDRTPRASWNSHDVTENKTIRIEHDSPRATETYGELGEVDSLRDIPPTTGCIYLGSQLPHFALAGDTEDWMVDRAVTAWLSPRRWFQPSRGFPSGDEVRKLKSREN